MLKINYLFFQSKNTSIEKVLFLNMYYLINTFLESVFLDRSLLKHLILQVLIKIYFS